MTREKNLSSNISEKDLIKDLLLPTSPRTWRRRTEGQLKTWATTIKADLEPTSGLRVFDHARWRKEWVKVSSELAQDRRAWGASVRGVVNLIGDAGSNNPAWISTQVQVYLKAFYSHSLKLSAEVHIFPLWTVTYKITAVKSLIITKNYQVTRSGQVFKNIETLFDGVKTLWLEYITKPMNKHKFND